MYDMPQLHRQMLEVLGINDPDKIIPLKDEIPPRDPAAENMDLLNGKPVKAFLWQDQEAHITAHMAAAQDPKIQELVMQSPTAGTIQASLAAHVTEHVAFQYRKEIQKQLGVELPNPEDPLPEDVEYQLSRLVAEAAERVLQGNQAEQSQKQAQEQAEDPIIQMRQKELEIREQETQAKIADQVARLVLDSQKAKDRSELEYERIESQERQTGAKIGAELTSDLIEMEMEGREIASREGTEASKAAAKMTETLVKGAVEGAGRADERLLEEALRKDEK